MEKTLSMIALKAMKKNGIAVSEKTRPDRMPIQIVFDDGTSMDLPRSGEVKKYRNNSRLVEAKVGISYSSPMPGRGNPFLTMGIFTTDEQLNKSIDQLIEEYIEV